MKQVTRSMYYGRGSVGDEATNGEDYKALCDVEGACIYEKQDRIRTKSEREREAQRIYLLRMQQLQ